MAAEIIDTKSSQGPSYSLVACIGGGMSAVALGSSLKRWYGIEDIRIFERLAGSGGTWWTNTYPGCACDVPSALYQFSFELNPSWTRTYPPHDEIKAYTDGVAKKYGLDTKMQFSTEVRRCVWDNETTMWTLHLYDLEKSEEYMHTCKILFSASGLLSEPRPCDIPGFETFKGALFHSSRWDHEVNLKGKNVVVVGNGCTATQIVPAIQPYVEHVTQLVRTKHWILPEQNLTYSPRLKWALQNIPFALRLHRYMIYLVMEGSFEIFLLTESAAKRRQKIQTAVKEFIRRVAPAKYHELLIPDFELGCKRRIGDVGYLESLNSENITLSDSKILKIVPDGIETEGGLVPADVIVLATGFKTNTHFDKMEIVGQQGVSIHEHWAKYPGPGAYNCSAVSGFPNFFMILGPNTATGHTSALIAAENAIYYALRVLKPVIKGSAKYVEVKEEAEKKYVYDVQKALSDRVWNTGCNGWYVNANNWNSSTYPWNQNHFWYRCVFPVWSDWIIQHSSNRRRISRRITALISAFVALGGFMVLKSVARQRAVFSVLKAWVPSAFR